jgi:SAM-dependent methyltransferase
MPQEIAMDAATVKQTQHAQWSAAAEGWRKHDTQLQGYLAPVTTRVIAALQPGMRVLDLCSGTGEPALSAAQRVLPEGRVTGIDLAEPMLATAREKATARGIRNIEFIRMDGEALDFADASFDAATIRFGLMFMPNPAGCLAGLRRVLKRRSQVTLACWADPRQNPWASIAGRLIRKYLSLPEPDPTAPGPFAFADPARLERTLGVAGFSEVNIEALELVMADLPSGAEYVAMTQETSPGLRVALERLPLEQRRLLLDEIAAEIDRAGNGRAYLKGVTWIATSKA